MNKDYLIDPVAKGGRFLNKAVFLDRDGTINVEKSYLYKIEDFEFLPGVLDGMKLLQGNGYLLIIATNQSGIARGYYTEEDFKRLNTWMLDELKQHGIFVEKVFYCPHHPDAFVEAYKTDCNCRKPKLGMFEDAIEEFWIDLGKSYAIGDKIRDSTLCHECGCQGYLIGNHEKLEVVKRVKDGAYPNIRWAEDLLRCAQDIVSK